MLKILTFVLGPVLTNSYLIADTNTGEAAVIDPAWDGELIVDAANENNWQIKSILLTHAHFDHMGGVAAVVKEVNGDVAVALHPDDRPLYDKQGGASLFGMHIESGPEPALPLHHHQLLQVGNYEFEVRYAPGHTAGHVIFYCLEEAVVFSGDVVFKDGIGRTDLPGGDYNTLIESIREQILTIPDHTRIFSGHGPESTVGEEKENNPFLSQDGFTL